MKKQLFIISLLMLVMVNILGGCQMETKYKTQEEQIEFLKKHESQMTEYVKSFNKTIQTVEFDWNATDTGVVGNGTPQGGGVVIRVSGYVNDDPKLGFYIAVNSTLESTSSFEPEQDIYFLSNGVAYLRQGE